MRRVLTVLLLLLVPTGVGLWSAAQTPTHIVIMHTNDLHGQLLPSDGLGGIAEIATIIRKAKPDLILDAGDISTGTFLSDDFKGAPTIDAMNAIGYTSGTIGNHEIHHSDCKRHSIRHHRTDNGGIEVEEFPQIHEWRVGARHRQGSRTTAACRSPSLRFHRGNRSPRRRGGQT